MFKRTLSALLAAFFMLSASSVMAMDLPLMLSPVLAAISGTVDGSSVVVVDPYIIGAELFEDKNGNGLQDAGEQGSTITDASGSCSFADPLTPGSVLVMKFGAEHNGVVYELVLSREVTRGMSGDIIVSPTTTLAADDLTSAQVAQMLSNAGLSGITADMITEDPMQGIAALGGSVTDADIVRMRAAVATYVFLRIRNGSDTLRALTGAELYASGMNMDGTGALYDILSTAVAIINGALSQTSIDAAQAEIDAAESLFGFSLPAITAMDIVQTAVTIADRLSLIGYTTCNKEGYEQALINVQNTHDNYINSWISQLGMRYYGYRNRAFYSGMTSIPGFPADLANGVNSTTGVWHINSTEIVTDGPPSIE